jgi:hypothetical protein
MQKFGISFILNAKMPHLWHLWHFDMSLPYKYSEMTKCPNAKIAAFWHSAFHILFLGCRWKKLFSKIPYGNFLFYEFEFSITKEH